MRYFIFLLLVVNLFSSEDSELVQLAYDNGLKPVPRDFETLLSELHASSNDLSKEKTMLGKKLFFDKNLSLGRDISCASCHSFDKGGADGRPTAIGHKNRKNPFHLNTPTVLNTGFSKKLFWNGRSDTLQNQAKGPLQATFEMSITPELAKIRMYKNNEYITMFENVYGNNGISFDNIVDAISAYEKTLVTRGRYDDFLLGYFDKLDTQEKDGLKLFITKGCVGCHNGVGLGGQMLRKFPLSYHPVWSMDNTMHIKELRKKYDIYLTTLKNLKFKDDYERLNHLESNMDKKDIYLLMNGFFNQIDEANILTVITSSACATCHEDNKFNTPFPFENRGGFLGATNPKGYFRVPLLRNVVSTAPYFHNGEIKKLEDAIKIMGKHQSRTDLSDKEITKIISFFKSVDGKVVDFNQ
jgi:cytochrome c peroxidase